MADLFTPVDARGRPVPEPIATCAFLLRGFAVSRTVELVGAIDEVATIAPFRHMRTPGGKAMSVAMTGCGELSWVTDKKGYRYSAKDPDSGKPWPVMPDCFARLATEAAAACGFGRFEPDVCLINRYQPGAKMGLHQDRDEKDFDWPIVSVSLGIPATFLWGGLRRGGSPARILLESGDVLVWGGEDRLRYHGVATVREGRCADTGHLRYNLTFRKAG